jgi:hypothetical protein
VSDSLREKEKKLTSMSAAVKTVIDNYPLGHEFYGNQLKDDVVEIYPDAINMYPDTILKMARRHRRDSYVCIERNDSLYKRVESAFEKELRITREKREAEQQKKQAVKPEKEQLNFPFLAYAFGAVFVVVFLSLFFCDFFVFESDGRGPLLPPSFITLKSASVYNPAEPIYLNGDLLCLLRRIFTAAVETGAAGVLSRCAISKTVIPSITSLYREKPINQVENVKMLQLCNILLYRQIVKFVNLLKILKNSCQNLDYPLGRVYYVIMLQHCNYIKRQSEAPIAEWHSTEAKGELYEREGSNQLQKG